MGQLIHFPGPNARQFDDARRALEDETNTAISDILSGSIVVPPAFGTPSIDKRPRHLTAVHSPVPIGRIIGFNKP